MIIDPSTHTIVDANPVALDLMGRSRQEVIGSLCRRFVCPAEASRCPITVDEGSEMGSYLVDRARLVYDDTERIKREYPGMLFR